MWITNICAAGLEMSVRDEFCANAEEGKHWDRVSEGHGIENRGNFVQAKRKCSLMSIPHVRICMSQA